MKFLKHFRLIVLIFLPVCLIGMNANNPDHMIWPSEKDKTDKLISLDSYKITDYKKVLEAERKLIHVMAAAYAYEIDQVTGFDEKVAIATELMKKNNDETMQKYLNGEIDEKHTCYIVTIRDTGTTKILGFAIFYLKPEYGKGFVWLEHLVVIPAAQGRGLSRKLIFSIHKIFPVVEQILLGVRLENTKAQNIYKHFGFEKIQTHEEGFVLEYDVKKQGVL
jgi:ribosomal protein S18 acetylase RimI-like enzyme